MGRRRHRQWPTTCVAAVAAVTLVATAMSAAPATPAVRLDAISTASTCPAFSAGVHHYAPGTGKTVALTFDDGPGPSTSRILSILMKNAVRATFFNNGAQMQSLPALLTAQLRQGHTLGNHTWDHANMPKLSAVAQASEIDRATAEQVEIVGQSPCLFRPPYGNYDATTLSLTAARGLTVWNWSVDPEDWKADSASTYWVQRIVTRAEAGGSQQHPVVLFHNGGANEATIAALPTVIDYYRSHGYGFVDLLGHRGFAPYAPTGAPGPAAAATAAGLHAFWRDGGGHIRENTRVNGIWSASTSLGGATSRGPAATPVNSTTVLVAIVDTGQHVAVKTVTDSGASGWLSLGGTYSGRPAITADTRTGTVTVVARTAAGAIDYRQQVAGRWGAWMHLGGTFTTAPAVAATPYGGLTVAAAASDGALWVRHRSSTTWSAWRRVGGLALSADPGLVLTPDGRHLLAMGRDAAGAGRALLGSVDGVTWGSWQNLGGVLGSGPAPARSGSAIAALAIGTDAFAYLDTAASGNAGTAWTGWTKLRL